MRKITALLALLALAPAARAQNSSINNLLPVATPASSDNFVLQQAGSPRAVRQSRANLLAGYFSTATTCSAANFVAAPTASSGVLGCRALVTGDLPVVAIAQGGTGTASTLTGIVRGSASAMTAAELTGDTTTSGSNATTTKQLHLAQVTVVFSQSPYTIAATDSTISCDAASGAIVLNLPAATGSGRVLRVKKTDSSANGCTLTRAGSDTIDGATTVALTAQYGSTTVEDSGSGTWIRTHVNQVSGDATGTNAALTVTKINGVSLAGLATGILKNTTTTGAPSIAVAADFPTLNQNTTGTAAGLSSTNDVPHGGTGAVTLAAHGVMVGNGTGAVAVTGTGTAGQVLTSNGASADPTFQAASGGEIVAYKTAHETVNNSAALQNDDHLSVTLAGGGIYNIELFLMIDDASGTNPGFQADLGGGTATFTYFLGTFEIYEDGAGLAANGALTTPTSPMQINGTGHNAARFTGAVEISAGGTLVLRWAQNTAEAVNTRVLRGSYLSAKRRN